MTMNSRQILVVNPILTSILRGYVNADFVGRVLFPTVPVQVSGGKIITFGREAFYNYNTLRAPGGNTKRITIGYDGADFALENHDLEAQVPREHMRDASKVPNVDLAKRAILVQWQIMQRQLEEQQAALATNAANYDSDNVVTLAGKGALADIANIAEWFDEQKEKVRSQTAQYPNVLVMGPKAWNVFKNLKAVTDRYKHTTAATVTQDMLASFLDIPKIVVGKAVGATPNKKDFHDVWGNDMVLAYVPTSLFGREEPSYGYTYEMAGSPSVENPYWDENTKSWVYGVNHERKPVIAGKGAAVLIKNVG